MSTKLFLGISTAAFVLLLGVIGTAQVSNAQPSNTTAPAAINVNFFDTRDNAKYSYKLPVDNQLQAKLTNLIEGILGSQSISPTAIENPTQKALISNQTATVAGLLGQGPAVPASPEALASPSGFWSILKKGIDIAQTYGPVIAQVAAAVA